MNTRQQGGRALAVIGGGNMGGAVIRAANKAGCMVTVAESDDAARARLSRELGDSVAVVATGTQAVALAGEGAGIVLAVKPQAFASLASDLVDAGVVGARLVISIMAGVSASAIAAQLGGSVRVVRTMPNLPLALGLGMTAMAAGPRADEIDLAMVQRIFEAGGSVVRIEEALMDSFTALAGSGPAYVFYLAEAMERSAGAMGFTAEDARTVVRQTIAGASAMMAQGAGPAELRAKVTSKGGTTAAAVAHLDQHDVVVQIERAIDAARRRGAELSAAVSGPMA
jgi:pyrroline-5-carboxylate reductase